MHWIQCGARSFFGDFEPFGDEDCLDAMAGSPDWNRWWEPARKPGVDLLVHVLFVDDDQWQQLLPRALRAAEAGRTRKFTGRVEVQYRSTATTSAARLPEVAQWVRRDLERAITKLRARFRLTVPPELPHLDQAALGVARTRAEAWAQKAELRE